MRAKTCCRCGEDLVVEGDGYRCPYCDAFYPKTDEYEALFSLLQEEKAAMLAIRLRTLYDSAHKRDFVSADLSRAANDVLNIHDENTLARFYLAILDKDPAVLNTFLATLNTDIYSAREIYRFTLQNLDIRNVFALKSFLERHFKEEELTEAYTAIEAEAAKIEEGVYLTNLPRDVFLAYSSKDLPQAIALADFLEDNEFTVFTSVRNLRHGKGAKENYQHALNDAMAHCQSLVFLSTENSRSLTCDATRYELPYIRDNLPGMRRIEYLAEEYGPKTKLAAKIILKSVFKDLEWCREPEDLVRRLLGQDNVEDEPPTPKQDHAEAQKEEKPHEKTKPEEGKDYSGSTSPEEKENTIENDKEESLSSLFGKVFNRAKAVIRNSSLLQDSEERVRSVLKDMEIEGTKLIRYKGSARSLRIPDFITEISGDAFNHSSVEAITMPRSLTVIDNFAFVFCTKLRSIAFPALKNLTIGEYAFECCGALSAFSIRCENLVIKDYAFRECKALSAIVINATNTSLGHYVFDQCSGLIKFELGRGNRSLAIGNHSFHGCPKLRALLVPTGKVVMGDDCFVDSKPQKLILPRGAKLGKRTLR